MAVARCAWGEDYLAGLKGEGRRAVDTPTRKDSRPIYLGVILGVKAGRLG
jgi:hypothetical protein